MLCKYVCMYVTDISSSHVDCFYFDLGRGKGKVGGQNRKWRKQQQRIRPFPVAQIASPRREFNIIGEGDGEISRANQITSKFTILMFISGGEKEHATKIATSRGKSANHPTMKYANMFDAVPVWCFWIWAQKSQGLEVAFSYCVGLGQVLKLHCL